MTSASARPVTGGALSSRNGLRLLWVVRSPIFIRNLESILRALAGRGHSVHLAFERGKEGVESQWAIVDRLVADQPRISVGRAPVPRGPRATLARRARAGQDYLRYLGDEYAGADALRARAGRHAPPGFARLVNVLEGRPRALSLLARALRAIDLALGPHPEVSRFLEEHEADAVVVTPLTHFGSPQVDVVAAARRRSLPSALVAFSWDNLTNKSLMHELPDLAIVWNEAQAAEAVSHHGLPPERIRVTGAAAYDHWFGWSPSSTREELCERAGLDPSRPYLLYVCSSRFIAREEPAWVKEWLRALRSAPEPLAGAGVLVRPHPLNATAWEGSDIEEPGRVAIFPRGGRDPADPPSRADYFDSLHHATAVVGINTTALVESAIVGRRTYTVRTERFRGTQEGTLHFHHLRQDRGGPLNVAATMEEHLEALGQALADAGDADSQLERFVERFVRPRGLESPVAPRVAAELEELARSRARA